MIQSSAEFARVEVFHPIERDILGNVIHSVQRLTVELIPNGANYQLAISAIQIPDGMAENSSRDANLQMEI